MATRRDILKYGAAGTSYGLLAPKTAKADLVFPDGFIPSIVDSPSPPVTPFKVPLNVMPISKSVPEAFLNTPAGGGHAPDPQRHQRFNEFKPRKHYVHYIEEFLWNYHTDFPYNQGSWAWGFRDPHMPKGITPGMTIHAKYGDPIFLRRINNLPPLGAGKYPLRNAQPHHTFTQCAYRIGKRRHSAGLFQRRRVLGSSLRKFSGRLRQAGNHVYPVVSRP